jgi:hypothetical protein
MPSLNVSNDSFFGFWVAVEHPGSRLITWAHETSRLSTGYRATRNRTTRNRHGSGAACYQAAEHQRGEEVETTRADPHPTPSGQKKRERQTAALEQTTTCCPVRSLSSAQARAKALRTRLAKRDEASDKPLSAWKMCEEVLCHRLVGPFEAKSSDQRHSILCAAGPLD